MALLPTLSLFFKLVRVKLMSKQYAILLNIEMKCSFFTSKNALWLVASTLQNQMQTRPLFLGFESLANTIVRKNGGAKNWVVTNTKKKTILKKWYRSYDTLSSI